jgi:serine/threonine protein kinase/Tol biopolymer transport system component
MSLPVGTKLGPYEIQTPLGAGGMGEVYRARDTRLDRAVAVKILPSHLSSDPDAKQRFEREAKIISSLNHPHICVLHDVGHQDGINYLVMECVEGETLAKRLEKGPLALEQVLKLGAQIADALDKAHRSGVIHRDLKPSNVMLTSSGVKLLDFGLAKPTAPLGSNAARTTTKEVSPVTAQGTVVGTFQYMSPEQVEGKELDGRSDIFSFGSVLYEMLTGQRAFQGQSQLSVASAILEKEPAPIGSIKPMTSPSLDRCVRRCLAKDPDQRWQSAGDLADELRWISGSSDTGISRPGATRRPKLRELVPWTLAAAGIAAAIIFGYFHWRDANSLARKQIVASITGPEKMRFNLAGDFSGPVAVSPDGTKLVFSAGRFLWLRNLSEPGLRRLEGTQDAVFPFWSPDSRSIGFEAAGALRTLDTSGGPPVVISDAPNMRGGSWGPDGTILYAPNTRTGIFRVEAIGGTATPVTHLVENQQTTHRWPVFLPDGKHFLYLAANHADPKGPNTEVFIASLDGKLNRPMIHSFSKALYAPGYLLYLRGTSLTTQPFDLSKLEFTGDAVSVAEDVTEDVSVWGGVFSVSQNGVLAYQAGRLAQSELRWYDRQGKILGVIGSGTNNAPRLSRDGTRLAVDFGDPNREVWIIDLRRGVRTRLTFGAIDGSPVWSPDGTRIAFSALEAGDIGPTIGSRLMEKKSNGEGQNGLLEQTPGYKILTDWSPDGRFLLVDNGYNTLTQIYVLPLEGDRKSYPFLKSGIAERSGHFSPDGRWVAYTSGASGRDEVYVAPFPGPGGKLQVSSSGGRMPRWRGDGRELFFFAPDDTLMAAEVVGGPGRIDIKEVRALFRVNVAPEPSDRSGSYDVTADGTRFVVNTSSDEAQPPITLVLNWTASLPKK